SDRDPQERVSLARFRRAPGSGSGDEPDRVSQALQENDVIDSRAVPEAAAPHRSAAPHARRRLLGEQRGVRGGVRERFPVHARVSPALQGAAQARRTENAPQSVYRTWTGGSSDRAGVGALSTRCTPAPNPMPSTPIHGL